MIVMSLGVFCWVGIREFVGVRIRFGDQMWIRGNFVMVMKG